MSRYLPQKIAIPYGCYKDGKPASWSVKVRLARKPVSIKLKAKHIIEADAGSTGTCARSNCVLDRENHSQFDHPVLYAHSISSATFVVDKFDQNNQPYSAVKYSGEEEGLVEDNDKAGGKDLKARAISDPASVERIITLKIPRRHNDSRRGNGKDRGTGDGGSRAKSCQPRGWRRRAINAELIDPAYARKYLA